MSASQQLIWTAIPNGFVPGSTTKVQLSVVVSPRLITGGTTTTNLGPFTDWTDWPGHKVTFTVTIGSHTIATSHVTVVPPPVPLPNGVTSSDLWQLLFTNATPVVPYTFSTYGGEIVRSYPAHWVRQFLVDTYTEIASSSPTEWPGYDQLFGTVGNTLGPYVALNAESLEAAATTINGMLTPANPAIPPANKPDPSTDLVQAQLFTLPLGPATSPAAEIAVPDFHQIVSTLGKYPVLLRAFGLVFDLEVTLPSGLASVVDVSVTPTWTPTLAATQNFEPKVATTSSTFLPAPRTTDPLIAGGRLRLSDDLATQPAYPVVEVDLDGSAAKSIIFAQAIPNAQTLASQDSPTTFALPALRSSGLTLIHTGTAADFANSQAPQATLNSDIVGGSSPVLHAEDVTQGYRIDVYDTTTNRWHQLCARVAAGTVYGGSAPTGYVIGWPGGTQVTMPLPGGTAGSAGPGPGETGLPFDEGWIELSLVQSPPHVVPVSDLYLHETMCRWTGWSLVADRPGKHWGETEPKNLPAPNSYNPPNRTTGVPLQAAHAAAPGTLPVLRYGRTYQFGARAVDLAGNSLVFDDAPTPASLHWASPSLRYGRMEPVASPVVVPVAPRTPGEHLLNLVIRSETYSAPAADATTCQRHLAPGSLAEEMAEAHGLFDLNGVPNANKATYDLIADRAGMTYATASVVSSLGGLADTPVPGAYNWPAQMYYYPAANLAVPYLPDVLSRGAAFLNLPLTAAGNVLLASFADGSDAWPAVQPLSLVLNAGNLPPALVTGSDGNVLNVYLPHGSTAVTRLSSYLNASDLDSMGLWEWMGEAGVQTNALKQDITSGQHWMFTPYREIEFVHAVRTPNPGTVSDGAIATRLPGKTYALFSADVDVDFAGSSKIDLLANWVTPYDDGTSAVGAVNIKGMAHVADIPLAYEPPAQPVPSEITVADLRHEFGDTLYRSVTYTVQTTSRFLEYFQETAVVTLNGTNPVVVNALGLAEGATVVSVAVAAGEPPGPAYQLGVDYTLNDTAGTLTPVSGGGLSGVSQVDVRYVTPPVTNAGGTTSQTTLAVPSTARPAVPHIAYVLPLFSFDTTTSGSEITSTRTGNAVRVYLERPWFSSGAGEELGVVIWPGGVGAAPPNTLANLVTSYGRDPTRAANPVNSYPSVDDFPLVETTGLSLLPIETTDLATEYTVDVAGHSVQFEPSSHQLWYADVEIDTRGVGESDYSYFPFVRLALVRYQPNSITNYEISPIAVADIVQVAPNRVATITFPTGSATTVNVSVAGVVAGAGNPIGVPPNAMTVTVQEQQAGVTDPDLQWVDQAGTEVTLQPNESAGYNMLWTGTVTLPGAIGSLNMRLRIAELENYLYEPPVPPGDPPQPEYVSRIVYLDTIVISTT
jgi:hypothetical protein